MVELCFLQNSPHAFKLTRTTESEVRTMYISKISKGYVLRSTPKADST